MRAAALLALAMTVPASAAAQTVAERATGLDRANARAYLEPVASGLDAALGASLFEGAGAAEGVRFRVGLQAAGSLVPDRFGGFEPVRPRDVAYAGRTFEDPYHVARGRTSTPTAVGEGDGAMLRPTGAFEVELRDQGEDPLEYGIPFPDGADLSTVPLAAAEASLALPSGTVVAGRFLPEVELNGRLGRVSSWGLGVRQSVTAFLPGWPVDAAVAAGYRRLTLGEVLAARGGSASLVVSRDLELITVFASGGVEASSADVEYAFDGRGGLPGWPSPGETIAFEIEGEGAGRFTGGIRMDLFAARLSVSYSVSEHEVLQARLSLGP